MKFDSSTTSNGRRRRRRRGGLVAFLPSLTLPLLLSAAGGAAAGSPRPPLPFPSPRRLSAAVVVPSFGVPPRRRRAAPSSSSSSSSRRSAAVASFGFPASPPRRRRTDHGAAASAAVSPPTRGGALVGFRRTRGLRDSSRASGAVVRLSASAGGDDRAKTDGSNGGDDDGDDDDEGESIGGDDLANFLTGLLGSGNVVVTSSSDGPLPFNAADLGGGGDNKANKASSEASEAGLQSLRTFDLKPREVVEYLDRFVIQQDDAKKVLAVAVCDHYNHCRRTLLEESNSSGKKENDKRKREESAEYNYAKPNVLLAGPTGVGKTYLMKCIARLIGVPFAKADATKFSETGIVGRDTEDVILDLVSAAGGNATLAQFGIVYVDEVDKIANGGGGPKDGLTTYAGHNTRGVQNNFLKLLEDTEVSLDEKGPMAAMGMGPKKGSINTRNVLFIFSGAFTGLDEELRRKREKKPFGLDLDRADGTSGGGGSRPHGSGRDDGDDPDRKTGSYLRHAETADFVRAGLEPEFIGRVPVRVALDALSASDLKRILVGAEGSVLGQFERDFDGYGIAVNATDGALSEIARLAEKEGTGARGLVTVLERTLRNHKYELPSTPVKEFVLDRETVSEPKRGLNRILSTLTPEDAAIAALDDAKRWERRLNVRIGPDRDAWLTSEAADHLVSKALSKGESAYSMASRDLDALPDAIRTVGERTGQDRYPLGLDLVKDPRGEIANWLRMVEGDDDANEEEGRRDGGGDDGKGGDGGGGGGGGGAEVVA